MGGPGAVIACKRGRRLTRSRFSARDARSAWSAMVSRASSATLSPFREGCNVALNETVWAEVGPNVTRRIDKQARP